MAGLKARPTNQLALQSLRVISEKNYRLQDIQLSNSVGLSLAASTSKSVYQDLQSLVENTGLEPVTSWLQTRRSPS